MPLPTIPSLSPSTVPATSAVTYSELWIPNLQINAPDPAGKKTLTAVTTNYDSASKTLSPLPGDKQTLTITDIDAMAAQYPNSVGAPYVAFVHALAAILPVIAIQQRLVPAQAALSQQKTQLGLWTQRQTAFAALSPEARATSQNATYIAEAAAQATAFTASVAAAQTAVDQLTAALTAAQAGLS